VTFQSDREGDVAIFEQHIGGTGLHRLTTPEPGTVHVPESWSPHGKHLSYSVVKDSEYSLWVLSVDDGKAARFGDVQSLEPLGSMFSPDGRWIVYHSLPRGANRGRRAPACSPGRFLPTPSGRPLALAAILSRSGPGGRRAVLCRGGRHTAGCSPCRSHGRAERTADPGASRFQHSLSLKLAAQTTTRSAGVPGSRFDRRDVSTIQRGCARGSLRRLSRLATGAQPPGVNHMYRRRPPVVCSAWLHRPTVGAAMPD